MNLNNISICIGDLIGIPNVCFNGTLDAEHDEIVASILECFNTRNSGSIVLDIVGLKFDGVEGACVMIDAINSVSDSLSIHIASSSAGMDILSTAKLNDNVRFYLSTEEIAAHIMNN